MVFFRYLNKKWSIINHMVRFVYQIGVNEEENAEENILNTLHYSYQR